MGANFLIDTNAGIDFLNGKLPPASTVWLEQLLDAQQLAMSVVVRIELLSWQGAPAEMQALEDFIAATEVLPLDEPVTQQTIRLRQQHRVKLPDAIIAATALAHNLPLLTRNVSDFQALACLAVINPHDITQLPSPVLPSSIRIQDEAVLISQGEDGSDYIINTAELDEIRGDIAVGLSEWTMQLLDKTWITPALLLELAVLTQKIKPDNQINWHNTFAIVEKKNYLEKAGEILDMSDEPGGEGSAFGEVLKMINLGQEEQNDETNTRIAEIVNRKLAEYGLPIKD